MPKQPQISATVVKGLQLASGVHDTMFAEDCGSIALQKPEFKKQGFDLDAYFPGSEYLSATINLSVAPDIAQIKKPSYILKDIRWTDKHDEPGKPPFVENFFLDPVEIIFKGRMYKGLFYIPDPATKPAIHKVPSSIIEVIAQKIPDLGYGNQVSLVYNPNAVSFGRVISMNDLKLSTRAPA